MKAFCLLLLITLLVACGAETNPKPQPNPSDKTAPSLTSSIPANGASSVPTNVKLAFNFSEAMDEATLELSSNPSITLGTVNWNASSTGLAFDNSPLTPSTTYTLTLKAKDVAGNALAATSLSFSTSDVSDTTAPGTPTGLVATPADGQVTLTWQANSENDIAGYTVYLGTSQDTLEPKDFVTTNSKTVTGLSNGTTYFFAIDAVDKAANKSDKTKPVSATPSVATSDVTAPKIQSSTPADNATNVLGEFSFHIVFSESMDKNSLTFNLEPAEFALERIIWSDNDTVLDLTPLQLHLFSESSSYKLTLNAKDKAGNELSGDKEINFTTGSEVHLLSSTPADGATNVPVEKFEIRLEFSKAMDTTTFGVKPTLEPVDIPNFSQSWTLTWTNNDTVLTLNTAIIPGYFLEDTTYKLLLTGTDKTGAAHLNTTVSFKTVGDSTSPTVVAVSPLDEATDVPLSPLDVFIYFDDLMDEKATLAAISSSPELPCTWQHFFTTDSPDDKDLESAFACRATTEAFQANTPYTITVSTEAKDTSGNTFSRKLCRGTFPCSYSFTFTTLTPPPPKGNLQLNISGLPIGQKKVRVTGSGFDSGFLDEGTLFSNVLTGDYSINASGFTLAPGKPACRIYTPTPGSQTVTVAANQTVTATVTYESFSCALIQNGS